MTIVHGYYLTTRECDDIPGTFIAVISDGSPQLGHEPITILDVDRHPNIEAARAWFERMKIEQPWEKRS